MKRFSSIYFTANFFTILFCTLSHAGIVPIPFEQIVDRSSLKKIDTSVEPNPNAYQQRDGKNFYYNARLAEYDLKCEDFPSATLKLPEGINRTDRPFEIYLRRLGLKESELRSKAGNSILSVGEGYSDFTARMSTLGWDAWAVDADIKNEFAPDRSVIAYAQKLPFQSESFDLTVSVWLIPHFFRPTGGSSMFNPSAGRMAIMEMIRVTKIGGEVLINPLLYKSEKQGVFDFLESLKVQSLIDYQFIQPDKFDDDDEYAKKEGLKMSEQYGFVRIKRLM